MTKRWKVGRWKHRPNYVCLLCPYATLDRGAMVLHARERHPGGAEDVPGVLAGVDFASDEAAELAISLGLTARSLAGCTPSGRSGGYTVADVRAAHRSTHAEN